MLLACAMFPPLTSLQVLGKTLQTISFLAHLKHNLDIAGPHLTVVLKSAMLSNSGPKCILKLTQNQNRLLRDHEGCLKCCYFYTDHNTDKCKNNYPNPYMLPPLTEEAAIATRAKHDGDTNSGVPSDGM
jgi:hypothetical protein